MATSSNSTPKEPSKKPSNPLETRSTKVAVDAKTAALVSAAAKDLEPAPSATSIGANLAPSAAGTTASAKPAKPYSLPHHLRPMLWKLGALVVAVLILFLGVFAILIYTYKSDSPLVKTVAGIVPYPAEKVNGSFVSYKEYLFQLDTYKSYLSSKSSSTGQTPVNFSTAAGQAQLKQVKAQVVTQLKTDEVVRQLAKKYKVTISGADVNAEVATLAKQAGGDAKLKEVLSSVYGWNENDLKHQLSFQLLEQKLETTLASDPTLLAQAKASAQNVLNQINAGGDFATLAKKYSQDSATAANGGELGTISKTSGLDANFITAAYKLSAGQVSSLVKTADGYEIIKVNSVNGANLDVSHILIQPIDFQSYLNQQVSKAKASTYIHI